MRVKNVVKVMNFHALLRVDTAKRTADKYLEFEKKVTNMIQEIENNRNFILDRRLLAPDPNNIVLNIYIGSDFGFCSNFNSQINTMLLNDKSSDKIIIGNRVSNNVTGILFRCSRDEEENAHTKIMNYIEQGVKSLQYSKINIIYNHYENAGNIHIISKEIFPLKKFDDNQSLFLDDYICEGDINELLRDLVVLYLNYELTISCINSLASENILRQEVTSQSLKKIEEIETVQLRDERKAKRQKSFAKVIDNYIKVNRSKGI